MSDAAGSSTPPEEAAQTDLTDESRIVVTGQRTIVASLEDVEPEDSYDEERVASYAVSTVGELLGEIRAENGDEQPEVLVNGRPVRDLSDIADLPVEAIKRVEQLPRGAAQRVGGASNQRAYNVVLAPQVRSATVTLARQEATEGGWGQSKGEALLTYIRNQDRLNLTLRRSDSDLLLEADRDIIPRTELFPYSSLGNVVPFGWAEIDPAISARFGSPVALIALNGALQPTITDLLAGAGVANPSQIGGYRSLRPASETSELALAGSKELADWLSLSANGRLNWSESTALRGLPSARFLVQANNAFTPFTTAVYIALNDPTRPLTNQSETDGGSLSATLNGNIGKWHATVLGRYDERSTQFAGQSSGGFYSVPNSTNPFAGSLAETIAVFTTSSTSRTIERQLTADAEGPLFNLPAGVVLARVGVGARWVDFESNSAFSALREIEQREFTAKAGLTIPLTGNGFLPEVGTSELAVDFGRLDLGRYGKIDRYTVALNWSPVQWLRFSAAQEEDGTPIFTSLLASPVIVTENVPYFDPLRGETVDVRLVTGGATDLKNPTTLTKTLSATLTPLAKYNLQLNLDYQESSQRNLIGAIPEASTAIVTAFPDRFVRDATKRLVQVDTTAVNFVQQDTSQLRFGASFRVPISAARTIRGNQSAPTRRIPATNLQVNVSHTLVLDSTTVIRAGLPAVDLLAGGAVGIGGGGLRNYTSGSVSVTRGQSGFRLNASYRGPSYLQTGTLGSPDRLTFGSLLQVDLRAFVDLGQVMPRDPLAKGTRLSLVFDNLLNDRQSVTNLAGITPQAFQRAYRDPVGRSVMVELRKVF